VEQSNLRQRRAKKADKQEFEEQSSIGQAAAAKKNRQRLARLAIIEAYRRLRIPMDGWPEFVRAFSTDAKELIEYNRLVRPPPFQPPDFDALNQSPEEWLKLADQGWKEYRIRFRQRAKAWVLAGVDEEIVPAKKIRAPGKRASSQAGGRNSRQNTPLNRRDEWAALYLLGKPLKEVAGAEADASTVGRIARETLRQAGWSTTPTEPV
jgi:hypothetical protein